MGDKPYAGLCSKEKQRTAAGTKLPAMASEWNQFATVVLSFINNDVFLQDGVMEVFTGGYQV